ncbi:TK protein kinase [Salpingoeca rosetta]|uniref:receptor protein-tyrosine kinase n=1 Tax=Salpingoeca rosetta (strain ATCC 50818 / BSB-021) TaxID=946362 RepID=F2UKB6_SALR5|nr:TK protein kinase [Salpingoeca rosetta]EGD77565.1 TK protein kinase [Salpingoeca rosetta]|eukprot:XP_004990453.1 TK protein kinase [Salpingoeca rosetta]
MTQMPMMMFGRRRRRPVAAAAAPCTPVVGVAVLVMMQLCFLAPQCAYAVQSVYDPSCRSVTLRGMRPGFATRLLAPYERTVATRNGAPVFQQANGGDYLFLDVSDSNFRWYVTDDLQRTGIYALSPSVPSPQDPAAQPLSWLYNQNRETISSLLNVTCSACKQADHERCAQENKLCSTSPTGQPVCTCDEARGLRENNDGTCSVDVPTLIDVYYHPMPVLVNDWVRMGDGITDAYVSDLSPATFSFSFPDYWTIRISATSVYAIVLSSSLDASTFDTWIVRDPETGDWSRQNATLNGHYCSPSECPAGADCRRPTRSSPLECFCDERDFRTEQPDGTCEVLACPSLVVGNMTPRPDLEGTYTPVDGLIHDDAPVYIRQPEMDLYLFRINDFWAIGANYTSTRINAYSPFYTGFHPSVTTQWKAYVGAQGAFVDATPTLSCRSCDRDTCPGNLQCIFNTTTSNTHIQEHTCGCPEGLILLTQDDGTPECVLPEMTVCKTLRFNTAGANSRVDGVYVYAGMDTLGQPTFIHDAVTNDTLRYTTQAGAWIIVDDEGEVNAVCVTDARDQPRDCTWRVRRTDTGAFATGTTIAIECVECRPDAVCPAGKICVSNGAADADYTCACPLGLDPVPNTQTCLSRENVCSVLDLEIPGRVDANGVYTAAGIRNGRLEYASKNTAAPFTIVFNAEFQRWHLVHEASNLIVARLETEAILPIDSMVGNTTTWAPFIFGAGGYTPQPGSSSTCSRCATNTCSTGFICRSPRGASPSCTCNARQIEQDRACVDRTACPRLWLYLDDTRVAPFTLDGSLSERPRYRGAIPRDSDTTYYLRFSNLRDIWFMSTFPNSEFTAANASSFATLSFFPEDFARPTAVFDFGLQTAVGFSPSSIAFVCDVCQPDTCGPTEACETALNGTAVCVCAPGDIRFDVDGESVCNVPSLANAIDTLIVSLRGDSTLFDLVASEHINGRFFYRERSPNAIQRRATRLIFWLPSANGGAGAWAFGTPGNPVAVATTQGLPHTLSWDTDITVNAACDVVDVVVSAISATAVTLQPTTAFAETTTVYVSPSRFLLHEDLMIVEVPPSTPSVTVTNLSPEQHYFAVAFTNQSACVLSGDEPLLEIDTLASVPTAAPQITTVDVLAPDILRISFTVPASASDGGAIVHFIAQLMDQDGDMFQITVPAGTRTFLVDELEPFTQYRVRIAVVNAAGQGPFSPPTTRRTDEDVPSSGGTIVSLSRDTDGLTAVVRRPNETDHNGIITQLRVVCSHQGVQYMSNLTLTAADIADMSRDFTIVLAVPDDTAVMCEAQASTSAGWSDGGPSVSSPAQPSSSGSGTNAGAVAAGVLVPLLLLIAIAAFLVLRRRPSFTKPYSDPPTVNMVCTNRVFDMERFKEILIDPNELVLQEKLGEGQFGTVHAGTLSRVPNQPVLDKPIPVAVKYLKTTADVEDRRVFLDEAWRMRHLVHDHVVRLLGVCLANEPSFILIEFMDGGDLENFLRMARPDRGGDGLPPSLQANFMHQVCSGLAYLGSVDFVHRDLASRNILMTREYVLKIGDFGMARNVQGSAYYTSSKRKEMPLRWMAPEAVRENKYTHLSDVYSFGVVIYEIATFGDFPWAGVQDDDVARRLIRGEHMPLDAVPGTFHHVILQCWQPVQQRPRASEVLPLITAMQTPQSSGYVVLPAQDANC